MDMLGSRNFTFTFYIWGGSNFFFECDMNVTWFHYGIEDIKCNVTYLLDNILISKRNIIIGNVYDGSEIVE